MTKDTTTTLSSPSEEENHSHHHGGNRAGQCCTCVVWGLSTGLHHPSPREPPESQQQQQQHSLADEFGAEALLGSLSISNNNNTTSNKSESNNNNNNSETLCQLCRLPQRAKGVVSLILDLKFDLAIPFNFRNAADGISHHSELLTNEGSVCEDGLHSLKMSGSGQPTAKGFKWLLSKLGIEPSQLVVVDLRQEGHGFANGKPVTWHSTFNWANVGKDYAWILEDEQRRLDEFNELPLVNFFEEVKTPANPDGVTMPHRTLPSMKTCQGLSERELVENFGANYARLTVADHAGPGDEQVDVFVKLVRKHSAHRHFHMHCRAGRGRTTMFMSLLDMLFNARIVPCDDIIRRQGLLPKDKYDLMKIPKGNWKGRPMEERARFLLAFYEYAKEFPVESSLRLPYTPSSSSSSSENTTTTSESTTTTTTTSSIQQQPPPPPSPAAITPSPRRGSSSSSAFSSSLPSSSGYNPPSWSKWRAAKHGKSPFIMKATLEKGVAAGGGAGGGKNEISVQ